MYSDSELYKDGSWLKRPVKTVLDILPLFEGRKELRILDLGCGVGRNSIPVAAHFRDNECQVDCVDILELAIQQLEKYASEYDAAGNIRGYVCAIDDFAIPESHYDWIMAVSSLEHVDCKTSFLRKLAEIRDGLRAGGIVSLIINSEIREFNKSTALPVDPQFEINLSTQEMQAYLEETFLGWKILKTTVRPQRYDIPRDFGISDLQTNVITFVAQKP